MLNINRPSYLRNQFVKVEEKADTGKLSITEEEKWSSICNFEQNNIILEKFMANQKVRKSAEKKIKKSYVHMRKRYQKRVHPIRKYGKVTK